MINKEVLKQLNEIYSKSKLEKGIFYFAKKFYLNKFFKQERNLLVQEILQRVIAKKALNSTDTAILSFSVFEDETIFREFLVTLPQSIQILIEKLLWVEFMPEAEVEQLLNEPIATPPKYSYSNERELKNEFYFFSVHVQYVYSYPRSNAFILSLHPLFKKILLDFYPKPVHYYFIQIEEIPETPYRFTAENSIVQELPKLLSYFLQDGIKYSVRGRPTDATINKLQKAISPAEFFSAGEESINKVRSMLMAGLLFNFKITNVNVDTVAVIKELFNKQYIKLYTSQFLLMHLKGWGHMDTPDYHEHAEHNFFEVLKQLPPDKWISAENLIDFIQCRFIPLKPINSWGLNNRVYYEHPVKSKQGSYIEKTYTGSNSNLLVHFPFVKGTIFLLAAFGLVEIAYAGTNTAEFGRTFYSAYDGLQYFRVTALGRYVLGFSDAYEAAGDQQQNKLQFSADSLMILGEGNLELLDIMLANFAEKAGNNRFRVTHAQFLKDCRNKKDIDNKIALFKKTILAKLPLYWEQQFKTWQHNAQQLQKDSTTLIFKIPDDEKELQKMVAQDPVLKSLVLKAEQFHILVLQNNLSKFKNRMKELGYLVE